MTPSMCDRSAPAMVSTSAVHAASCGGAGELELEQARAPDAEAARPRLGHAEEVAIDAEGDLPDEVDDVDPPARRRDERRRPRLGGIAEAGKVVRPDERPPATELRRVRRVPRPCRGRRAGGR